MRNKMTGHVILNDVTHSMIKSLSFSNSWLFCISASLLGSYNFMSPPRSWRTTNVCLHFSGLGANKWLLASEASESLANINICRKKLLPELTTPAWENWSSVDASLHQALGYLPWYLQSHNP